MMDDYAKLLIVQSGLEKESSSNSRHWTGLSVNETIRQCILIGWNEKAEKVRSEFKVPDKR